MEKQIRKLYGILFVLMAITGFGISSINSATGLSTEDQAKNFVEKVVPIDLLNYNITLTKHTQLSGTPDIVQYTLKGANSEFVINCYVKNNVFTGCNIDNRKGQPLSDRPYASLTDAAVSFLEKYQNYTGLDSTNMVNMLADVDVTKNSSTTIGNTKLTISNIDSFGTEITEFSWAYTINGANYTSLQVGFQRNGIFDALYDDRGLYSIGDTTVNISREQAIDIAMKKIQGYSYDLANGAKVSGFNISEDKTNAQLLTTPRNSVLRPYWNVRLFLNQTYPGSVIGFYVCIWANSGEAYFVNKIAVGGDLPGDNSNAEPNLSAPAESSPLLISDESNSVLLTVASGITIAAIAIVITSRVIKAKRK